jgi:hypothetical protein
MDILESTITENPYGLAMRAGKLMPERLKGAQSQLVEFYRG